MPVEPPTDGAGVIDAPCNKVAAPRGATRRDEVFVDQELVGVTFGAPWQSRVAIPDIACRPPGPLGLVRIEYCHGNHHSSQ